MSNKVFFVNAFANTYYKGNTAAVVPVSEYPSDSAMLALAKEFGFSETAYVMKLGENRYHIRWFTPEVEVRLCGHATLASAKTLFAEYAPNAEVLYFNSLSGELSARRKDDLIELNFPVDMPAEYSISADFLAALSDEQPEQVLFASNTNNLMLVYPRRETILTMQPDFARLVSFSELGLHGIGVTAVSSEDEDYICRYFAPWEGINEDPVTGSAQTFLAPYWEKRLNMNPLRGFQASQRGGRFELEIMDERVLIRGKALIYMRGEICDGWDQ